MATLEAKALSNPLRVQIFEVITEGAATTSQLADTTGASLGLVKYHTTVLCSADCIQPVEAASSHTGDPLYEARA